MSSNRPMFDDEDLPAWLVNAGITYGGKPTEPDWLQEAVSTTPSGERLPWSGELPFAEAEATPPMPDVPVPWSGETALNNEVPSTVAASLPPVTVPWSSEAEPAAELPFDWQATKPSAPTLPVKSGTTGDLPWKQGKSESQPPADTPAADEPMPWEVPASPTPADEWLFEPSASATGTAEQAPSIEPAADDWLQRFASAGQAAPLPTDLSADEPLPWDIESGTTSGAVPTGDISDIGEPLPWEVESAVPALQADTEGGPGSGSETPSDDWLSSILGEESVPLPLSQSQPEQSPVRPQPEMQPETQAQGSAKPTEPTDMDWLDAALFEAPAAPETPAEAAQPLKSLKPLPASEPPVSSMDEVPDWFANIPTGPLPAPEPQREFNTSVAAETPQDALDWMAGASEDLESLFGEQPAPESPEPEWLSAPVTRPPAAPEAPRPPASGDDIPEWLRDIAPLAPPAPAAGAQAQPDQIEPELDWLADIQAGTESAGKASVSPAAQEISVPPSKTGTGELKFDFDSADLDKLLDLPGLPDTGDLTPRPAAVPLGPIDLEAMDDLDKLLGAPVPSAPAPEPTIDDAAFEQQLAALTGTAPALDDSTGTPTEQLPGWVEEMRPAGPVELRLGNRRIQLEEQPLGNLPDSLLQLRERIKNRPALPNAPMPGAGPLAGIANAINPGDIAIQPDSTPPVVGTIISDLQAQNVKRLQSLLSAQEEILRRRIEEEEAEPQIESVEAAKAALKAHRPRARIKYDRMLLTLLLALIVIAPFFTGLFNLFAPPRLEALAPEQRARFEAVFDSVDSVQAGQPVLIAFEYGPTGSGELDDLARAVLRDLLRRGARPVLISTNPSGIMHAHGLIMRLAADADEQRLIGRMLAARTDYVVLRYLPGGAGGVRAFANALFGDEFQQQVVFAADIEGRASGLDDEALALMRASPVVVLTETQDDVRTWAEQYRAGQGSPLRMVMLTSVASAAAARAYAGERVVGPLSGLRDAMIYQQARGLFVDTAAQTRADQRWQSIGLSALLAAVVILLGAAVNLLRSLRRRRAR